MKLKYIQWMVVAGCFFCLSCQMEGGTLIPILQDGTRITSSSPRKKDGALQYDTENLSMKVSGGWEPRYGDAGFILIVKNKNLSKLKINFDEILLQSTLQKQIKTLNVEEIDAKTRKIVESNFKEIETKEVKTGEFKIFVINTGEKEKQNSYKSYSECFGSEISITIKAHIEIDKVPKTTEYTFKFKYAALSEADFIVYDELSID
jgi:hypothetical protein